MQKKAKQANNTIYIVTWTTSVVMQNKWRCFPVVVSNCCFTLPWIFISGAAPKWRIRYWMKLYRVSPDETPARSENIWLTCSGRGTPHAPPQSLDMHSWCPFRPSWFRNIRRSMGLAFSACVFLRSINKKTFLCLGNHVPSQYITHSRHYTTVFLCPLCCLLSI